MSITKSATILAAAAIWFALPGNASADETTPQRTVDPYISVFAGVSSPLKTDITETSSGTSVTGKDTKLDTSVV